METNSENPNDFQKPDVNDNTFEVPETKKSLKDDKVRFSIQAKQQKKKGSICDNLTPLVLLIGLGSHSIFEGLALGISDDYDQVAFFAIAIILHKGAAGMSLGISMQRAFPTEKKFTTFMMFLFAIFSPIGVLLGMLL